MKLFRNSLIGLIAGFSFSYNVFAAGVVGDGTPASCTEAAFDTALVGGGAVTFNCGGGDVTVPITTEKAVAGVALTINGANLITLDAADASSIFSVAGNATMTLQFITLANGVNTDGGAIINAGTTNLNNVTIVSSAASARGGAIRSTGVLNVQNSLFNDNTAGTEGGAISTNGAMTISGSQFLANNADFGGAIRNSGGANISSSLFQGNNATTDAGALLNRGTVVVNASSMVQNSAADDGGAIDNFGSLTMTNTSVIENGANDQGGGMRNVGDNGIVVLNHVSIASNSTVTPGGGGGLRSAGGSVTFNNTVVASNSDTNCVDNTLAGFAVNASNFSSDATCPGFIQAATDDIRLGPLQSNGSTLLSVLPLPGSVLIDSAQAAECSNEANSADQRGNGRFEDGDADGVAECDVGAAEIQVGLVGQGDPANCSDASLSLAVATSELVILDCGSAPVTIPTANEFVINGNTLALRGLSDVTLDAGGVHRHFDGDNQSTIMMIGMKLVNGAAVDGAAIRSAGFTQVQDSSLTGNAATGNGGALAIDGGLFMLSATLSGNTAGGAGGAIRSGVGANIQVANSTISGNTANTGGGISSNGGGTITHSSIINNTAATASGLEHAAGLIQIRNSIVAINNNGTQCGGVGGLQGLGVNLATDGSCPGVASVAAAGIQLGALQFNGGVTQTHALGANSVAIGAADAQFCTASPVSSVDQRGVLRDGNCDVGAFEVVPPQSPFMDLNGAGAGTDNAVDFIENNAPVILTTGDGFIIDADSNTLQSLTVTISNRLNGNDEILTANTNNTGLAQSFVAGVLEITGLADLTVYNQVLRSIAYENVNETPNETTRVLDFSANDGLSQPGTAQVTVTVTAVNDPPNLVDDQFNTDSDTTLDIAAPGVLANDSDAEDGAVQANLFSGRSALGALVSVNQNGSFGYDPDGQFDALGATEVATDTFEYTVEDSQGEVQTATVTIFVAGINDAPIALDDTATTDEDTILTVLSPGVLTNDSDQNQQDILTVDTATSDAISALGAIVTLQADGSFTYDPTDVAAIQQLAPNQSVTDSFSYVIVDGQGGSDTAVVTLTVTGLNDNPEIVAPLPDVTTPAETPVSIDTAQAFSDPDSSALTFSTDGPPPPGLTINPATGVITGSVSEANIDEYVIVVVATDSAGASAADGFVFDVTPIPNRAPNLVSPLVDQTMEVGDSLSVDVSGNFNDIDSDVLTFSSAGLPLGFNIDSSTAIISGTADLADASGSPFNVTITAADPDGLTISDQFLLTVNNFGNLTAFIGGISPIPAIPGSNVTVPVTVINNAAAEASGVVVDVTLNGVGNVTGAGCAEVSAGPPRQFECNIGTLAAGISQDLNLSVSSTLPQEQWLSIAVRSAQQDTDLTDNVDAEALFFVTNSVAAPNDCLTIDATAFAAADMDLDGDQDFIIGTAGGSPTQISFNTAGALGTPPLSLGDTSNTQAIGIGDFDGNGRTDLITANVGTNRVFFNNSDGFNLSGQSLGATNTQAIDTGDIDGDGDIDLIFANGVGQDNLILLNNGNASFSNGQSFTSGDARGVALVDIDADQFLDIVSVEFGGQTQVRSNNGSGQFVSFSDLGIFAGTSLAVGDIDGNSSPDLIVGVGRDPDNPQLVPGNRIFINNGTGTFTDGGTVGRNDTQDLYLVDVDGDTDLDLVTQNTNVAQVLYLNNGAGVFTLADAALATEAFAIRPVRSNGDASSDLLLATANNVCLLVADGSGSFNAGGSAPGQGAGGNGGAGAGNSISVETGADSGSGGGGAAAPLFILLMMAAMLHRRNFKRSLAMLMLLGASGVSHAGSWFIGGNLGAGFASRAEVELGDDLRARGHDVSVSLDEVSTLGALYAGYRFNRRWEVTAGYLDLGDFDSNITGNVNDINALIADLEDLHPAAGRGLFTNLHRAWVLGRQWRIQATVGLQALSDTDIEVNQNGTLARTDRGTDISWNAGFNIFRALSSGFDVGGSFRTYDVEGELVHSVQLALQRHLALGRNRGGIPRNDRPWGFDPWGRVR